MSPMYVDVHVLQTVPPSNLNRDDAGTPKQAVYGGVRRSRVSSQAWKRATRKAFIEGNLAGDLPLGTRTKRLRELLEERFVARGTDALVAEKWSGETLEALGVKVEAGQKTTPYLLFVGRNQVDDLSHYVESAMTQEDGKVDTAAARDILDRGHALDVALFGRMVADVPALNVDAAVQVAHALSTHAVEIEFDYFTAVEDENEEDETGAAMIGTVEFSSATLYRYATVGVHQLQDNLAGVDEDTIVRAVEAFLRGFVRSMPSGKQNSFAHHTAPQTVVLVVRDDQPVNLVSAFEDPVRGEGLAAQSTRQLAAELGRSSRLWGSRPRLVASTYTPQSTADDEALAPLGEPLPFDDAVSQVLGAVRDSVGSAVPTA